MLELNELHKNFPGVPALNGVSLSVPKGEFLALLGPSGSGKTTLLRTIAGLEFCDSGVIGIDGQDMANVPAQSRNIGFVFQNYALFRHMNIAENISFGLTVRPRHLRPSKSDIRIKVEELLDLMGLAGFGHRFPEQLSGGQRQRVALARALAIEPRLLLLDEPFGALDAQVRKELRHWLRGLHDRLKLTSIFVTHDQDEALEMADRVAVLRAGRIEQIDTPEALYGNPTNAFVHEFLGESLNFEATVVQGNAYFIDAGIEPLATNLADGPVVAVIRPHEIRIVSGTGPGVVESIHRHGPLSRVAIRLHRRLFEILLPVDEQPPRTGTACTIDLGRARLYAGNSL
jgi:sulfate transport system ATP-binding protein